MTTTSLLPKKLLCSPVIQSAKTGEDVSYACNLQNVQRITAINVAGSQFSYISTLGGSQGGTFTGDSATIMVDLGAENQIIMTLTSVTCDMEGEVTVTVNGDINDTVNLRIISKS